MTPTSLPPTAARLARDSYRQNAVQFEDLGLQVPAPDDCSPISVPYGVEPGVSTFEAASWTMSALGGKLLEIMQRNANSAFDLATRLTEAKDLVDVMRIQTAYWCEQVQSFVSQASELQGFASQLATTVTPPLGEDLTAAQATGVRFFELPKEWRSWL